MNRFHQLRGAKVIEILKVVVETVRDFPNLVVAQRPLETMKTAGSRFVNLFDPLSRLALHPDAS